MGSRTTVMDPAAALVAGLVAGLAIAMQVGAVSLLLVELSVVRGPRVGVAAGMGVATVDFA
jgi:threonine/homoserine/homoserine lactone efflux protein